MMLAPTPTMPVAVAHAATILVVAVATFMAATHTLLLGLAGQRASLSARARIGVPAAAAAFLAVWFAIAITTADQVNFPLAHPEPLRGLSLAIVVLPFALAVAALFAVPALREINATMPASWLIRIQAYRMAGFIFLFPFLAYGTIPTAFALGAGLGDILTGALAIPVAALVERRGVSAYKWARAWNALGMVDLILAPTLAVLSGARVFDAYPLGVIALFAGPPLGLVTHIYSLRNLSARAAAEAPARRPGIAVVQAA